MRALEMEFNDKAARCVAFMKNRKYNEDTIDAMMKLLDLVTLKALEQDKHNDCTNRACLSSVEYDSRRLDVYEGVAH